MSGSRVVGLNKKQSVPRLLSTIGKQTAPTPRKDMKDVPDDAPPLSSSDLSDDDSLSSRGDIKPSQFRGSRQGRSSTSGDTCGGLVTKDTATTASRSRKTRASAKQAATNGPTSSPRDVNQQPKVAKARGTLSPPPAKKLKRSPTAEDGSDSQLDDLFSHQRNSVPTRRGGNNPRTFSSRLRHNKTAAKSPVPSPGDSDTETESPPRSKFWMPSLPAGAKEAPASPERRFKAVPDMDNLAMQSSPVRKKRLKMPKEKPGLLVDDDIAEVSQLRAFQMPKEDPGFFDYVDKQEQLELTISSTGDASTTFNPAQLSPSPPTDLASPCELTHVCPMCNQEVEERVLADYKRRHPRARVSDMQRFCQAHKRRSARDEWDRKGYPDINWNRLGGRIAKHYGFLRKILEGERHSYFAEALRDQIKSGQNRTLLKSDVNLTPGYYGIRGLRAMSENLIREFSALLRKRSLQDRLVSARGYTGYLQSVLVPELAVQLIMEDMHLGEEEARKILVESSAVGELLNDEIADVVEESDDNSDSI